MSYAIVTDSCANLTDDLIDRYGIEILPMVFRIGDKVFYGYENGKTPDLKPFYEGMRQGAHVFTSCVEVARCTDIFTALLDRGLDVLYIGVASSLSVTCQVARMVLEQLRPKYPGRKIGCVDSLSVSLGLGLLVLKAAQMREMGAGYDEVRAYLEENKLKMCHWFTVENLVYLKRGGRISAATYAFGSVLGVKPILHIDEYGRAQSPARVHGRKKSLDALVDRLVQTAERPREQTIGIGHGDCPEAAAYVLERIREKTGAERFCVNCIDSVVGAHSGPGTLALFFMGAPR